MRRQATFCVSILMLACPQSANSAPFQDAISDAIQENGEARVIVEMRLPLRQEQERQSDIGSDHVFRNRSLEIADLRRSVLMVQQDIRFPLAQVGIAMEKTYDALPFFVTTVDMEQYEALLERDDLKAGSLDTPIPLPKHDSVVEPLLYFSRQKVNVQPVWDQGFTGQGQVVVVIDSGIDPEHPMFTNKIVHEACFSTVHESYHESLCPSGGEREIGHGSASHCPSVTFLEGKACEHGTFVAGIAVGNDPNDGDDGRGIAIDSELIPIQVFTIIDDRYICSEDSFLRRDRCSRAFTSALLDATNYVVDISNDYNIAAVNMSVGGEPQTGGCDTNPIKKAVDILRGMGIATVAATGNDGETNQMRSPACVTSTISVSAYDQTMSGFTAVYILNPTSQD